MSNLFAQVIKEIRATCEHRELMQMPAVRAEYVWEEPRFVDKRIFIRDANLKQCARCWRVFFPREYDGLEDKLRDSVLGLAHLLPLLSEVGVQLGETAPAEYQYAISTKTAESSHGGSSVPRFTLSQVVLPESTRVQIEEALVKVRFHKKIYFDWGFNEVDPSGKGVAIIFYGPPGTGKTRCAEALAAELKKFFLSVNQADLSGKYMGDLSKNIKQVFQTAREQDALLFFDEAHDVLGERFAHVSQVAEAEINAARSTLLIELERFEGIVVFATNYYKSIEPAFHRRIAYHVRFDLPDLEARKRLWDIHLVERIPLREDRATLIETLALQSEGLTGGDILATLRLSFAAALRDEGEDAVISSSVIEKAIGQVKQARFSALERSEFWKEPASVAETRKMFGLRTEPPDAGAEPSSGHGRVAADSNIDGES